MVIYGDVPAREGRPESTGCLQSTQLRQSRTGIPKHLKFVKEIHEYTIWRLKYKYHKRQYALHKSDTVNTSSILILNRKMSFHCLKSFLNDGTSFVYK